MNNSLSKRRTVELYYFSGTGNSLAVARALAAKTEGNLLSIPSQMGRESIIAGAEVIGMVFPVYHKGIPLILKRFVEKLVALEGKYVFGVYTYGDTPGVAVTHLARLVRSRGGQLAAGFGVHLPYNYLTPPPRLKDFFNAFTLREIPGEAQQALFAAAPQKIENIAVSVNAGQSGTFEITSDLATRIANYLNLNESLGKWAWLKITGVEQPTGLSFLESRQLMDRRFYADENCTGCGTCSKVCPAGNIAMVGDKPVWQHRCEQCFACLHWCPQAAIQFGATTSGKKRYHHPDIKLADMLKQASGV